MLEALFATIREEIDAALSPDAMTALAADLNTAMSRDPAAQLRYLEIYGVRWSPIVGRVISHAPSTFAATVR